MVGIAKEMRDHYNDAWRNFKSDEEHEKAITPENVEGGNSTIRAPYESYNEATRGLYVTDRI